jgi:aspartate carbamoyltransferase catalytic subunit
MVSASKSLASLRGRDVLSIRDFTRDELELIFDESDRSGSSEGSLRGKLVALLFFEPSTRTHSTFEIAAQKLGCDVTGFSSPDKSSSAKGETLHDTVRMYSGYDVDCFVIRHNRMGAARLAAEVAEAPVVNAGDGSREHPTQTMVDLYTIRKAFGRVDGLHVGILGDLKYGRTASSLSYGLSNYDVDITFIAPDSLRARPEIERFLERAGASVHSTTSLQDVIGSLDVLYVTRIQKERIPDPTEYERVRGLYQVNLSVLKEGKRGLKVMHPLPRVDELAAEVDGSEYAQYFTQAAAGVPLRMTLLRMIMDGGLARE